MVVLGVTGRIINEHIMTDEEPFSVSNVYWYNTYSDAENPPRCTPAMYNYHVILTRSMDPDVNVKQMIKKYVKEHNIKGLYRQDPFGICFYTTNIRMIIRNM